MVFLSPPSPSPLSRLLAFLPITHCCISYISFPMHPAKWQSEWGSLKSASIRQRNVVRKCFALFTFLLHSVEALLLLLVVACLLCFVVVAVCVLAKVVVVAVCLCLFLAGHPSFARCVLAFVRRACFGFWFLSLRFLSHHWTCCSH